MLESIHVDVQCTYCCRGVFCCMGNDNRRIVSRGNQLAVESSRLPRLGRAITGRRHETLRENQRAREQLNVFLVQNFQISAPELVGDKWTKRLSKNLTTKEFNQVLKLAEAWKETSSPSQSQTSTLRKPNEDSEIQPASPRTPAHFESEPASPKTVIDASGIQTTEL